MPTWNYAVVHVHGIARIVDQPEWVRTQMDRLTDLNEGSRANPWAVSDAPPEYIESLLQSLVGIELTIERVEGKTKASQNQPAENRRSVLDALDLEHPESALTRLMHTVLEK